MKINEQGKTKNYLIKFILFAIFTQVIFYSFGTSTKAQNSPVPTIDTVGGGLGDGVLGRGYRLDYFSDFTLDKEGNIFFSHKLPFTNSELIRRVDAKTNVNNIIAGLGVLGVRGNTPALNAAMAPFDMKTDSSGRSLFISNFSTIDRIDLLTGNITRYAGDPNQKEPGDGGLAINADISAKEIQFDSMDNLFFYDISTETLRFIDRQTGIIKKVAGGGKVKLSNVTSPISANEIDLNDSLSDQFFEEIKFVVDKKGDIFFHNKNEIFRIDTKTNMVFPINYVKEGFNRVKLRKIAIDSDKNLLFVASIIGADENEALLRLDSKNNLTILAGNKKSEDVVLENSDNISIEALTFSSLEEIFVDSNDNIFLADTIKVGFFTRQAVILKISSNGQVTIPVGVNKNNGDGDLATKTIINAPEGLAIDNVGNIFVSDTPNHRIRRIDALTNIITTVAGTGKKGFSGDNNPAVSAMLNSPTGLIIDKNGNLYIADSGNGRVRKVDKDTGVITTIAGNPEGIDPLDISRDIPREVDALSVKIDTLFALALDLDEKSLFISKFENIFEVNLETNKLTVLVPRVSDVNNYVALAVSQKNELIIADQTRFCDDEDESESGIFGYNISTSKFFGIPVITKNSCFVSAVTVDSEGSVFIYNPEVNMINKVDTEEKLLINFGGSGIVGFSGDKGPFSQARFSFINTLVTDKFGNIYFTDKLNNAVRVIKGLAKAVPIRVTKANLKGQRLNIEGTNFGKYGAKVFINGQDVSEKIIFQKDKSLTLEGAKKSLGIIKGTNEILVKLGKESSNTLTVELRK